MFRLISDYVAQNADEITFNLGCQHFTNAVSGLHEFYIAPNFQAISVPYLPVRNQQ